MKDLTIEIKLLFAQNAITNALGVEEIKVMLCTANPTNYEQSR